MGLVTNVICAGLFDDPAGALERINAGEWNDYRYRQGSGFARFPEGAEGGTKALECDLFVGAFNYLDLDALKDHLRTCGFTEYEDVELLVKGQEDDGFSVWRLQEGEQK